MPPLEKMYKPRRAAEVLDLPDYEIWRMATAGKIASYGLAQNAVRIKGSELERYLKRLGRSRTGIRKTFTRDRFTVSEATEVLDCSLHFVYHLIRMRELDYIEDYSEVGPVRKVITFIPRESLEDFIERKKR